MWRPKEGCENPFKKTVDDVNRAFPKGIPRGYHILLEAGRNEGFEAGLVAMLEGLRKEGKKINSMSGKLAGYNVFIPEG